MIRLNSRVFLASAAFEQDDNLGLALDEVSLQFHQCNLQITPRNVVRTVRDRRRSLGFVVGVQVR